jgi:hypothetical protein
MHWLEMLRMRVSPGSHGQAVALLVDSSRRVAEEPGLTETRVYASGSFGHDLALLLLWDTPEAPASRSRAGLAIAEALRAFGLVDHSFWTGIAQARDTRRLG